MNQYAMEPMKQLELFEGGIEMKKQPAKRVNVVSLKLVRERSFLYPERIVRSPEDAYKLFKEILEDADRELFVVIALSTKNIPLNVSVCHVGSLNASLVHPREVVRP